MATDKKQQKPARYRHSELKYRDIKKMAIERGMPFPEVVSSDFYSLVSFIDSERAQKPNPDLVLQFDLWLEGILKERGADYLVKPSLRLSYVSDEMREGSKEKPAKEKKVKEKKPPRERDSNNLLKGTKKSYTFELAKKGYSLDRIKRRVLKKFPEASEKSIIIWYRQALGIKHTPKPKEERKPRVKKEKTPEQIKASRLRARERKKERALLRKQANERTEAYRESLNKKKRNGKRKKKAKAI